MKKWITAILMLSYLVGAQMKRPNVVFIIADDMGWDDVSFHGSDQIQTPNIDLLAYTGVALERYYSHCLCTPSRSALLTGKFSYVTGMQGFPLVNTEDRALPLTEKLLPEYFKDLGYATHLVGKWHVGAARTEYLPTSRGFDSHFGHRSAYIDYYEYVLTESLDDNSMVSGLDLYMNLTQAWDVEGYITDVYTQEAQRVIKSHDITQPLFLMVAHNAPHAGNELSDLQAPPEYVRAMRHIESPQRRIYSAMVKKLDESIGDIVEALLEKGILEDTIIVFVSDNGGMTSGNVQNFASNRPLRGLKFTPYEGGTRVNGLIWNKNFTQSHNLWKGYIHVADWLPTLLGAVGADTPKYVDGINLWDSIKSNKESKRHSFFEIDDYQDFASVTHDDYKLVTGKVIKENSNHQGHTLTGIIGQVPSYKEALENSKLYSVLSMIGIPFEYNDTFLRNDIKINCHGNIEELCYTDENKICLFNIKDDPCEYKDISAQNPDIIENLYSLLQNEMKRLVPRKKPFYRDPRSHPKLHNYTWNTWMDGIA